MKTFGYILLGILVLLIAVVVIVPLVFDLIDYKDEISAAVKETTGRELAIDGDIDLSLLPVPTIKVNGVRFANLDGAAAPDMVRIGVIEANVAIVPLFSGNIEVGSLTFVEPVIELEVLADGRANWQIAIAGGGVGLLVLRVSRNPDRKQRGRKWNLDVIELELVDLSGAHEHPPPN